MVGSVVAVAAAAVAGGGGGGWGTKRKDHKGEVAEKAGDPPFWAKITYMTDVACGITQGEIPPYSPGVHPSKSPSPGKMTSNSLA